MSMNRPIMSAALRSAALLTQRRCHPRRAPANRRKPSPFVSWMPAFAGMTGGRLFYALISVAVRSRPGGSHDQEQSRCLRPRVGGPRRAGCRPGASRCAIFLREAAGLCGGAIPSGPAEPARRLSQWGTRDDDDGAQSIAERSDAARATAQCRQECQQRAGGGDRRRPRAGGANTRRRQSAIGGANPIGGRPVRRGERGRRICGRVEWGDDHRDRRQRSAEQRRVVALRQSQRSAALEFGAPCQFGRNDAFHFVEPGGFFQSNRFGKFDAFERRLRLHDAGKLDGVAIRRPDLGDPALNQPVAFVALMRSASARRRCHPRESGGADNRRRPSPLDSWMPAFAGMTDAASPSGSVKAAGGKRRAASTEKKSALARATLRQLGSARDAAQPSPDRAGAGGVATGTSRRAGCARC